jgi:hypothetical protein
MKKSIIITSILLLLILAFSLISCNKSNDKTSEIETGSDGTAVSKSGIVALLADRYACMHTIVSRRVVSKYFEPEDITTTWYQFVDRSMCNTSCNAIVFTLEDYTAPTQNANNRAKK